MRKRTGIVLGVGAVLLVAGALYLFEWNLLRGLVGEQASQAIGRPFAINGDLHVELSLAPRIRAEGLVLGNAAWSSDPDMARIGRIEVRIDLRQLLRGRVVLPELVLWQPRILLEKNAAGEANWIFGGQAKAPVASPTLGSIKVIDGTLAFRDPQSGTDVGLRISSAPPEAGDTEEMMEVSGDGRFKGMPFVLRGRSGSLLSLRDTDRAYPIRVDASVGDTRVRAQGTLTDPFRLRGFDLDLVLQGRDLARLYPIAGVPLPPTPPYRLAGHLAHEGQSWTFNRFRGVVGSSDLSGNFSVQRARDRQVLRGDLFSKNLDLEDLGGLIGVSPQRQRARVLPDEPFGLEKIRSSDADIRFHGQRIVTRKLPIEDMHARVVVEQGRLLLAPLNFGVAGGNIVSRIALDANGDTIAGAADVAVRQLRLDRLFPGITLAQASVGAVNGRARLVMHGNSVAQMLGSADGALALMVNQGGVSDLLVRLTNLDLAHALGLWLTGDRNIAIHCLVADFAAADGELRPRSVVLDTEHASIAVTGSISLRDETLNLQLASHAKDLSLVALRGPIVVGGTFAKPTAGADLKGATTRSGLALGLGLLATPLAAVVPLFEPGGARDADCPALIAAAEKNVDAWRAASKAANEKVLTPTP